MMAIGNDNSGFHTTWEENVGAAGDRKRFILVSAVVALSLLGDALLYAVLPAEPGQFGVSLWQVGVLLGIKRLVLLSTN